MANIDHSIIIEKNLVEVYKTVTAYDDEALIKQWQPSIKSVGVTAGDPLRTGSMIAMKRNFITSVIFVNADVIDMQRNKRFDLKGIHGRFPFVREIEFNPNGRETHIKDRIWVKTGMLFFWWRPFLISTLRKQTAQEWKNIKILLEA
ncbi:MAG: hypothetical protein WBC91_14260 [Phototrophicaceae bacterium]